MIVYFSGTGNSRAVAEELGRHIGGQVVPIELIGQVTSLESVVVWVFPIYSWGLPEPVIKAIKESPDSCFSQAVHYMVATCGDDAGLADRQWSNLISKRRWEPYGAATVIMPNTYTMMKGFDTDPVELISKKLLAMPERVAKLAQMISCKERFSDVVRGKFPWIKSKVIYPWFMRYATRTSPFRVNAGCIGCSKCANNCPAKCIEMTADRLPRWTASNCYMCERCYHSCPRHAIAYGKSTEGKGQYLWNKYKNISST